MPLKLIYITNDPEVAVIAEKAGVDRIMVDMEYIGKDDRQGGLDTVQNHHTIQDIRNIRKVLTKAQLMVRVNPIHEAGSYRGLEHTSSEEEIGATIESGADVLMLPYFKSADEVERFLNIVDGRAVTDPLLETKNAVEQLDKILSLKGLNELHVGINDLSLDMGRTFMFDLFSDGTVQKIAEQCRNADVPFGVGGIAGLGGGMLPAEYIIGEHYNLGSTAAILSRSFCNTSNIKDLEVVEKTFNEGVSAIRRLEEMLAEKAKERDVEFFSENKKELDRRAAMISEMIRNR